jgi:hypothetical protein
MQIREAEGHILIRAFDIILVQKIANLMNNSKMIGKTLTHSLYSPLVNYIRMRGLLLII